MVTDDRNLTNHWKRGKSILICNGCTLHIKDLHPMKFLWQNLKIGLLCIGSQSDIEMQVC
jgi:hypothetical protein